MSAPEDAPAADVSDDDLDTITGPLEALLLMATEPMGTGELAQAIDVPRPVVWAALERLQRFYDETGRGFELREVGAGWRYYTRAEHHELIAAWVLEGQHARLSQAALETLAVVAYLQPISRSRVSGIRGVNVDGVMRTLVTRELIEEAGPSEETGAMLFRTTNLFLERLGYTSVDDLPPLAPHLPEASALEAELAGLAEQVAPEASGGEDGAMSEQASENAEIPTAGQARDWADAQAAEHDRADEAGQRADDVPEDEVLDRLSDPR
ncbi:SMC-Scp complex subunit ScpB [Propioniciclava soli]|uniref:SMC-Scp complex subunit ScpB n=1 Tax=Propioniciclava soli TaxID=2775081 RepID=UPI002FCCDE9F